jgi:ankyrin repeat protein
LSIASKFNHSDIAKLLLQNGADIDLGPALVLAIENENEELVELYLEAGARLDVPGEYGNTTAIVAAAVGRVDWLKRFVEKDPQLCCTHSMSLDSGLHLSSWAGHVEVVEYLLSQNRSSEFVNAPNLNKFTPLILAARNGHFQIVELLLQHNAETNAVTKMGSSALHLASKYGHVKVVELLMAHECDVNKKNGAGQTALQLAEAMKQEEVRTILLGQKNNEKEEL